MPPGEIQQGQGASLCDELEASLPQLTEADLSSELSQARREDLLAHALACARCGESLRTYRALLSRLKSLPAIPAPSGFSRRVEESLRSDRAVQSAFPWWVMSRVLPLAAMVVVGVAIVFALRDRPQVDGPRGGVELAQAPPPVHREVEEERADFDEARERTLTVASVPPPPAVPPTLESAPVSENAALGPIELADGGSSPAASLASSLERQQGERAGSGPVRIGVSLASADSDGLERLRDLARSFSGEDLLLTEIEKSRGKAKARVLKVRVPAAEVEALAVAIRDGVAAKKGLRREIKPAMLFGQTEAEARDSKRLEMQVGAAADSFAKEKGSADGALPSPPKVQTSTDEKTAAAREDVVRSRAVSAPAKAGAVLVRPAESARPADATRPADPAASATKLEADFSQASGNLVTVEIWVSLRD